MLATYTYASNAGNGSLIDEPFLKNVSRAHQVVDICQSFGGCCCNGTVRNHFSALSPPKTVPSINNIARCAIGAPLLDTDDGSVSEGDEGCDEVSALPP